MIPTPKNSGSRLANPEAKDLAEPWLVWEGEDVTRSETVPHTGMLGRVADAGTIGSGEPIPYTLPVQEEVLTAGLQQETDADVATTQKALDSLKDKLLKR
mgnify:CR=1 FL=1